jgi:hypothetical protein
LAEEERVNIEELPDVGRARLADATGVLLGFGWSPLPANYPTQTGAKFVSVQLYRVGGELIMAMTEHMRMPDEAWYEGRLGQELTGSFFMHTALRGISGPKIEAEMQQLPAAGPGPLLTEIRASFQQTLPDLHFTWWHESKAEGK